MPHHPIPPGRTAYFTYKNTVWDVMHFSEGLDSTALTNLFRLLDAALERYSRVFVLRFDLHLPSGMYGNSSVSAFFRGVKALVKSQYGCHMSYGWAREIGAINGGQHYHCVLFMSGHKVNYYTKLYASLQVLWQTHDGHGFSSVPNPYYFLYRGDNETLQHVIWRLSYLTKNKTKRPEPGVRNYGFSNEYPNDPSMWLHTTVPMVVSKETLG